MGVRRERGRLGEQLGNRHGQRLTAALQIPPRGHELVVFRRGGIAGGFLLRPRRAQRRVGVGYLGADLLVLGSAGLLQDAKLLIAGKVSGLLFPEQFGGFVVLAAEAIDARAPSLQVLAQVSRVTAGADEFLRRAFELGDGTLHGADLVRTDRHVTVGGGPAQSSGPRVEFRDLRVERRLRLVQLAAGRRQAGCRLADLLQRLRDRRCPGQLTPREFEVRQGLVNEAEFRRELVSLPLNLGDLAVELGEAKAASGGPVGRSDELGGRLGPRAEMRTIAELGPGSDKTHRNQVGDIVGQGDRREHRLDQGRRDHVLLLGTSTSASVRPPGRASGGSATR